MPEPGNGHTVRTQREIEIDLAQHRAHLGEAVDRLSQLARQTFDVKARARVTVARLRQQVRLHTWAILSAALAFGCVAGLLLARRRVLSP